ncbi:unnamed protein product [Coffea canephora]|uniref:Uncharacterized protein n=1 Tax=Coffea canephora TaxID=49390 RepID=A0A068VC58_COFCA|nr:unnamed protein product [Coffea canephora]
MLSISVEWRQGFHGPASRNILGVSSFSRGRGAKSQTEVGCPSLVSCLDGFGLLQVSSDHAIVTIYCWKLCSSIKLPDSYYFRFL